MGVLTTALMFLSVTAAVTNEQDYLRRKWREDLSDPRTGLDGATLKTNLAERVETLRDAQRHPEKYENLQVRVCGWNVRWNDIPKREQDKFILRQERIQ